MIAKQWYSDGMIIKRYHEHNEIYRRGTVQLTYDNVFKSSWNYKISYPLFLLGVDQHEKQRGIWKFNCKKTQGLLKKKNISKDRWI